MTALLQPVAPMAVLLEGGYNLAATALGTEASLRVLLGERPPPLPNAGNVDPCAAVAIQNVVNRQVLSSLGPRMLYLLAWLLHSLISFLLRNRVSR